MNRFFTFFATGLLFCSAFTSCSDRPNETIKNLKSSVQQQREAALRHTFFAEQAASEGFTNAVGLFHAISESSTRQANKMTAILGEQEEKFTPSPLDSLAIKNSVKSTIENVQFALTTATRFSQLAAKYHTTADQEGVRSIGDWFDRQDRIQQMVNEITQKTYDAMTQSGDDSEIPSSWSVCVHCGYADATFRLPSTCPICPQPCDEFEIFQ